MFPQRFFPGRMFTGRYFPKTGSAIPIPVIGRAVNIYNSEGAVVYSTSSRRSYDL
jgi:hypothetical protein